MKLKRKLLPIIGASAGIGATALALTGCSFFIGGGDSSWVNCMVRHVPEGIEQHKYAKADEAAATQMYIDQMDAGRETLDPTTFIEDFYWFTSNMLAEMQKKIVVKTSNSYIKKGKQHAFPGEKMLAKRDKIRLSDVTIKPWTYESTVLGKSVPIMRVSFTYEYDYLFEQTQQESIGKITEKQEMHGTTTFTNLPYWLEFNSSDSLWSVQPMEEAILDTNYGHGAKTAWHIKYDSQEILTQIIESDVAGDYTIVETNNNLKELDSDDMPFEEEDLEFGESILREDAWCYSWFMYQVAYEGEK